MVTDFKLFQVRGRRSQAVTGPVVMKMKMEMMLILTLYVPRPTLHCRLSGSGGQWERLSVKSGLIYGCINSIDSHY